jgi:hypothetical protein
VATLGFLVPGRIVQPQRSVAKTDLDRDDSWPSVFESPVQRRALCSRALWRKYIATHDATTTTALKKTPNAAAVAGENIALAISVAIIPSANTWITSTAT